MIHNEPEHGMLCKSIADLAAAWTMTLLRAGLAAIADLEEFIILLERAIWKGFVICEWPTSTCWQSDLAHTKKVKSHNATHNGKRVHRAQASIDHPIMYTIVYIYR